MATVYRVDPRIRAHGKARIDITRRARDEHEWQSMWKEPRYTFPFTWSEGWKQCIEYKVDDYAAEVGFFIDVLGLPVAAFSPSYAMFTNPEQEFFFGFRATSEGEQSTPPDTLRIQFSVRNLSNTVRELEQRGIAFEQVDPQSPKGSKLCFACFRTPHGISVDLMEIAAPEHSQAENNLVEEEEEDDEAFLERFLQKYGAEVDSEEPAPEDDPVDEAVTYEDEDTNSQDEVEDEEEDLPHEEKLTPPSSRIVPSQIHPRVPRTDRQSNRRPASPLRPGSLKRPNRRDRLNRETTYTNLED